jgi:signal peptidase II
MNSSSNNSNDSTDSTDLNNPKKRDFDYDPMIYVLYMVIFTGGIHIDQYTKGIILKHFKEFEFQEVTSFFNWVLVFNKGAAFSFLADQNGWQQWVFNGLAVCVVLWVLYCIIKHPLAKWDNIALSLIASGAVGNVIDRKNMGKVVDFIDFHYHDIHYPAFNVADSLICIGVAMYLWAEFRREYKE